MPFLWRHIQFVGHYGTDGKAITRAFEGIIDWSLESHLIYEFVGDWSHLSVDLQMNGLNRVFEAQTTDIEPPVGTLSIISQSSLSSYGCITCQDRRRQ